MEPKDDKKELIKPQISKLEVRNPLPEPKINVPDKSNDKKPKREDIYSNRQKTTARILYISIVIATIITIAGAIWATADIFMISGKLTTFLSISFGYQLALIGGFLAGFFFLLIFFIGLSKKGVKVILKITFKPRDIEEKYQNKMIIKLFAGAIMFSIFAIIIGIIISLFLELIMGASETTFSIISFLSAFDSTGPFVFFIGIFLFVMNALAFSLNWLWYNGYYLLLRLVTDLEKGD